MIFRTFLAFPALNRSKACPEPSLILVLKMPSLDCGEVRLVGGVDALVVTWPELMKWEGYAGAEPRLAISGSMVFPGRDPGGDVSHYGFPGPWPGRSKGKR